MHFEWPDEGTRMGIFGCYSDVDFILSQRVETRKREMFSQKSVRRFVGDSSAFVMIRHGRHVVSQCPKQKHVPPVLVNIF